jgi:hypothetical protein
MVSFWEQLGLSIVLGLLKTYVKNPTALSPYKTIIQHIVDDGNLILAGLGN